MADLPEKKDNTVQIVEGNTGVATVRLLVEINNNLKKILAEIGVKEETENG